MEEVRRFAWRILYISSLRVKLILKCQEVLRWVWPNEAMEQAPLHSDSHTTSKHAPQVERDFWHCVQHYHWKILGDQLSTKSDIEFKDNSNNFVTKMKEKSLYLCWRDRKGLQLLVQVITLYQHILCLRKQHFENKNSKSTFPEEPDCVNPCIQPNQVAIPNILHSGVQTWRWSSTERAEFNEIPRSAEGPPQMIATRKVPVLLSSFLPMFFSSCNTAGASTCSSAALIVNIAQILFSWPHCRELKGRTNFADATRAMGKRRNRSITNSPTPLRRIR